MNALRMVLVTRGVLANIRTAKLCAVLLMLVLAAPSNAQHANLLIIANRTLIDNQKIFGDGEHESPRIVLEAGETVYGLGFTRTTLTPDASVAQVEMTENPDLTFTDVGPTGDTIERDEGSWSADGFIDGQYITVHNSVSNNISDALVTDVTATKLTLGSTGLVGEVDRAGCTVTGAFAFITTEDYGTTNAVDASPVEGLFIDGEEDLGEFPWVSSLALGDPVAHAVDLDSPHCIVRNNRIGFWRGIGVMCRISKGETSGAGLNHPLGAIIGNTIGHCLTGIKVIQSDTLVSDNVVTACRDHCIHILNNSGNVQVRGNHFYGAEESAFIQQANDYRSANNTYADSSKHNLRSFGSLATFDGDQFQHCGGTNVLVVGTGHDFRNCMMRVWRTTDELESEGFPQIDRPAVVGLDFHNNAWWSPGRGNRWIGGNITLMSSGFGTTDPRGSIAIRVSADDCEVRTRINEQNPELEGAIGLWVPTSIKSGTFFLTLSGRQHNPGEFTPPDDYIPPFSGEGSRAVKFDTNGFRGVRVEILGRDLDTNGETTQLVEVPEDWTADNEIVIVNTTDGSRLTLTPGDEYPK